MDTCACESVMRDRRRLWLLSLLLFLFVQCIPGYGLEENIRIINKCCPLNEGLIKYTSEQGFNISFECSEVAIENMTRLVNVSSKLPLAPLEISQEDMFQFAFGFPKDCENYDLKHQLLSSVQNMPNIYCIDKIIAVQNDNSSINLGDGSSVILTCDTNPPYNNKHTHFSERKVDKCCPENLVYDTANHKCVNQTMVADSFRRFVTGDTALLNIRYGLEPCLKPKVANIYTNSDYDFHLKDDELTLTGLGKDIKLNYGSFCLDESVSGQLIARGCKLGCDGMCITKCCPEGEVYVLRNETCGMRGRCFPAPEWGLSPPYYDVSGSTPVRAKTPVATGIKYEIQCPNGQFLLNKGDPDDDFYLDVNTGYLYVPAQPVSMNGPHSYCLEVIDSTCPGIPTDIYGLLCFPEEVDTAKFNTRLQIFSVALLISSIFLAATLLVYLMLPALRNLHGQTLMCHVATMLVAYSCLTRIQWTSVPPTYCHIFGYAIYFSFLAAFSWLNIMCFDIWWTFGNIRSVQGMRRNKDRKKFCFFSLYAWGVPLLLTTTTYLIDEYDVAPGWLDPNVGRAQCWITTSAFKAPVLILFILPAGIQIGMNIVLFVLTAIHCNKVKNEIHRMQSSSLGERCKRRFVADRAKYTMNLKLFIVMGVSWVLEIVSSLYDEPHELWYVADFMNTLQGIPLFCILVLKRKVYRLMKKRLGLEKISPRRRSEMTMGATTTSALSTSVSESNGKKYIVKNMSSPRLSIPAVNNRKIST